MSTLVEGQVEKDVDIRAGGDGMMPVGCTIVPQELDIKCEKPAAGGDVNEGLKKEVKKTKRPRNQKRIPRRNKGDLTDEAQRSISRRRGRRDSEASTTSVKSTLDKVLTIGGLKRYLSSKGYDRKVHYHVSKFIKNRLSLAGYVNNVNFLSRCRYLKIMPEEYWQLNAQVRNTKAISDLLDECSYRLMMTDLEYNYLRKIQVSKWLNNAKQQLIQTLSEEEMTLLNTLLNNEYEVAFSRIKEEQRQRVSALLQTYRANDEHGQNDGSSSSSQSKVEKGGYPRQNNCNQSNNSSSSQGRYARRDDGSIRRITSGGGYGPGPRRGPQRNGPLLDRE